MKNVVAIFIAIILSFNTNTSYARELIGVIAGDANDLNLTTFKFSPDNADQQILKKDGNSIDHSEVPSRYGTTGGMRIYVDGMDIASSNYANPKKIIGMDLSDAAGWPRISIPTGNVVIDPKLGRFKFSEGNNVSPTLLSTFDTYDVAYGVSVVNDVAYVASFRSGLYVLDVANPKKPLLISNYNTTGWAYDVCVKNGYAFVADAYSGLQIIDVSNPKDISLVGNCYTYGWAYDVFVEGRYAYLADYRSGLQIIDVQDPKKPEVVGTYRTDGTAYGIWVSGQYAYIADGVNGLRIINISNPNSPKLVSTYDTKGKAYDVQVVGKYAFVADGQYSGLQIIDVSNPTAPKLVGYCTTPSIASRLYVSDGYVYIADGQGSSLQIINALDVNNPIIVSNYKTPGKAYGVCLSGKYAFVADGSNGLQIIDVPHPSEAPKGKVTTDCYIASDYLILTSPNGKEYLSGGKEYEITWRISGGVLPYTVSLWYSTDNGRTYPYLIASNTSGTSYKWLVPKIDSESLRIKVELTDGKGEYAYDESDASCSIDSTAPYVTGILPANKQANVPINTDIVITFSEIMNPSLTEAAFIISPDIGINGYKWSNDGKTLTVDLKDLGYNTLYNCIVTTQATDLYGKNPMIQPYEWAFYTEKQLVPLQSVLLFPGSGTSLAGGKVYDISWQVTGGKPPYLINLYYSTDGGKVYIPIEQGLNGTSYQWTVPSGNFNDVKLKIVSIDANGTQIDSTNNEPCKIDSTPPKIQNISIPNGAVNVPINTDIIINFSEAMDTKKTQESLSITPNPGILNYSWSNGTTCLTVDMNTLAYNTPYTCTISTEARDTAGNKVSSPYTWTFRTEPVPVGLAVMLAGVPKYIAGASQQYIEWQTTGGVAPYQASLYYCIGSGAWIAIDSNASSPFKWQVPMLNAESVKVRVLVKDSLGATYEAISDIFEVDSIPPTIKSPIPSSNAVDVGITTTISITFSEEMDTLTTRSAFSITPNPGILNYSWSNGTTCLTVDMNTLAYNTPYTCTVSTEARDTAGNKVASPYTWTFRTEPVPVGLAVTLAGVPKYIAGASQQYIEWQTTGGVAPYQASLYYCTGSGAWLPIDSNASSPFKWQVPILNAESVKVKVLVKDSLGATYEAISDIFEVDSIPPTIKSPIPSSNAVDVGITTTMSITFSEEMDTLTAQSAFSITPNPGILNYSWSNGTTCLTVVMNTLAYNTPYTCTVSTEARDTAGNKVASPYTWTFRTEPVPVGLAVTLAGVPKYIAGASQQYIEWQTTGGVAPYQASLYYCTGSGAWIAIDNNASSPFKWQVPMLNAESVKVRVIVKDSLGATYEAISDIFEVDSIPPTIKSPIPSSNAVDVGTTTTISITFSEEMDTLTTQSAFSITPNPGIINYSWSNGTTCLTVDMNTLAYNTPYTCTISTEARDIAGNKVASPYTWTFRTKPVPVGLAVTLAGVPKYIAGASQQYIEWQTTGGVAPYQASLYYCTGSGAWLPIDSNASSPFKWQVPMLNAESVKVRVLVKDSLGATSEAISDIFEVDSILPTIINTIPASNAVDVGRTSAIVINFSEEMNALETQNAFVIIPNPGSITYTWSNATSTLMIKTGELRYNTGYTCMITTAAKDTCAGNQLLNNYSWGFVTEKQISPLKVQVLSPNNNECWAGGSNQLIHWSMSGGTPPYKVSLSYVIGTTNITAIGTGILQSPYTWNVAKIDSRSVRIRVEVTDAVGNITTDESDNVFEIDSTPPTIISTTPQHGLNNVDVNIGTITIAFSEEMNTGQSQNAFVITPDVGIIGYNWSNDKTSLGINITKLMPNTVYTCIITTQAKDTCAGNPLQQAYKWSFKTKQDISPLQVALIQPQGLRCIAGASQQYIEWQTTGGIAPYQASLYYSMNSSTWLPITTNAVSPYRWTVPQINSETVKIKVIVKDSLGATYEAISDIFEVDSIPPTIINTIPASNAVDVGRTSAIVINFSEEMNALETQNAFVIIPNPGSITYTWSNATSTLMIKTGELRYNTGYTCMITTAAKDTCAGNQLLNNYSWGFVTEKQISPLKVQVLSPNNNECWAGGSNQLIHWSMSGGTPPYKVGLSYVIGTTNITAIGSGILQSPYTWNVAKIDSRSVRIRVEVTDAVGNIATDESDNVFEIDSTPPTIISTTPQHGLNNVDVNIGTITIAFSEEMNTGQSQNAFVITPDVGIIGYNWSNDKTSLGINITKLMPNTVYTCIITTQAKDTCAGNPLQQAYKWSFKTKQDISPLQVALIQPQGLKCIAGASQQYIEWQTTGGIAPYQASLYYCTGSGAWIAINSNASSPFKWQVPMLNAESVKVKVLVKDSLGATYEAISDIFEVDSILPTVINTTPSMNATDVGITTTISIQFSEEMNTAKTQEAFVISPNPGIQGYRWSNGSTTLTIELKNTLSYNTLYTCMLSTGVRDTCAGNHLESVYIWRFTTEQEFRSLKVCLITPQGGECLAGSSQYNINWTISGGIPAYTISLYYTVGSTTWPCIASGDLKSPYVWTVPMLDSTNAQVKIVVKDACNNEISSTSKVFEIDSTPPTVISVSPANGATEVEANADIVINFSEDMNTTDTQNAFSILPHPGVFGYTWSNATKTLTIDVGTLSYNTPYICMLSTGARDTCAGNQMTKNYVWSFETKRIIQPLQSVLISPNGGGCLAGGKQYEIKWVTAGGVQPYSSDLYYSSDGGGTWIAIANNISSPYQWTIPMINSSNVMVKVMVRDGKNSEASDISDAVFEIDSVPPQVIETIPANAAIGVGLVTNIIITFSEEMNTAKTQAAFVIIPSPGILGYRWSNGSKTLTVELNSLSYNTRYDCVITTNANDTCAGNQLSTNHVWSFTTQEKEIPLSVDLIKPDSNLQCLAGGAVYDICWAISGGKLPYDTRIFYSLGSGTWTCIKSGQIQSPYTWIVPRADTMGAQIKVMIIDAAGKEISDISPIFEIDSTPPTVISVSPANGLTDVDNNSNITIEFSEEMNHLTQDAFSILPHPGVLGFTWSDDGKKLSVDLGTLTYNTTYVCMVSRCAHDTCAGNHMTNNYVWSFNTKKVYQPLQTTVISPNGGKCLSGGRGYDVSWTTSGGSQPYSTSIYYCLGSNTGTLIAKDVKQSPYKWLVPEINSMEARIKVVVTDNVGAQAIDMSDADIEIDSIPPQIISVQPTDNQANVATNTAITITFSEEMDTAEGERAFMIIPAVGIKGYTWNGSHTTMTVTLYSLNHDTQYTCVITNQARDTCAGNPMIKNYAWSFTTEKVIKPLAVSVISPNGEKPCIAGNSKYPIIWNVSGGIQPYNTCLYYSVDNGSTWLIIAENTGTSPYTWQVPAIDSLNVKVKIVVKDASGQQVSDISDTAFEIDSTPPYVVSTIPQDRATDVPISRGDNSCKLDIPDFTIPACPNPSDYAQSKAGKSIYTGTVVLNGIEFVNGDVTFDGCVRVIGTGAIVATGNIYSRQGLTLKNVPDSGTCFGLLAGGNIEISNGGDRGDEIDTPVYAKGKIEIKPQYRSKYKLGYCGVLRANNVHIYAADSSGGAGFGSEGKIYSEGDCNIWALRGKDAYSDLSLRGEVKAYGNIDLSTIDSDVTLYLDAHVQSKKSIWLKVTHREMVILGKTGRIIAEENIKISGVGDSCCFASEENSKIYANGNIDIWCLAKGILNGEIFAGNSIELATNNSDQNINIGALVWACNGNLNLKVKHRAIMRLKRNGKLCAAGDINITSVGDSCYFASEDDTVISSKDGNVYILALAGETISGTISAKYDIELSTVNSDKEVQLCGCVVAGGNIEIKSKHRERIVLKKNGRLIAMNTIKGSLVASGDFMTEIDSLIQAGGNVSIASINNSNLKGNVVANYKDIKLPIVRCCFGEINGHGEAGVIVNFSEEMNKDQTQQAFLISPNPGIIGYEWSNGTKTIKVKMNPFAYDTQYSCVITTQAKDTCAGNPMLKNYSWSFTTKKLIGTLSVMLISFNNEKPCIAGNSKYPIIWNVSGGIQPYNTCLYYSVDNGSTWIIIAENTGTSPYTWQVPAIDSLNVKVKVVVKDASGQQVSDISDTAFEIDSTPPTVLSVSPANGAANVPASSTTIVIKFSEKMNTLSVQEAFSINPSPGIEGYTWSDGTSTLTIKIKPLTPDVKYYCQVSKTAKDTCAGNQMQAVYEWSFTVIRPFDLLGARILAPNGGNTWRGQYSVVPESIILPSGWASSMVGSGSAVMEDVSVGDADNDGKNEIYGVCGSYIYQFKWNGATWTSAIIGTQKPHGFHAVTVGDADNDGKNEIYVAYGPVGDWNGGAYQYKWDGSKWVEAWVYIEYSNYYGNYNGGTWKGCLDVKIGDVDNDNKNELWLSDSKGYVYQLKNISGKWYSMYQVCAGPCYIYMTSIEIVDANNDGKNELYGAKNDGNIYQFRYENNTWAYTTIGNKIGTQISDKMGDGMGYGDGDNDGKPELYRAVNNGPVYQIKYTGSTWTTTKVMEGSCGYDVAVGDGDNDGKKDVFAVDMNRRVYQLNWNGTGWDKTDIGQAGAGLMQGMSMGDGNNDGGIELYVANEDKNIYQFKMAARISVDIQGRLIEGQTNAIKWEAIGGTPPYLSTLYYSIDGGYSYNLISSNIGTFTFDWKVPSVNSKLCLIKVVITDSTNRSAIDIIDNFFEIDCIPPQIVNVWPTGENIPITADVVIGFDDVMNTAYTQRAFSISPGVVINGYRWDSYNNVMVVELDNLSYDTEYTCKVDRNAIDTCTGNPIIGVYTWRFKTVAQPDIPLPLKVELNCRGEVTQGDKISNTIRLTKEGDWYQKWGWDEYMVVYKLDPNMSYVSASPYGYYNAASHTLTWWVNMNDLPSGSSTAVWKAELNALISPNAKPDSFMENKLMIYPGCIPSSIEPWPPMRVENGTNLVRYTGTQAMSLPADWRVEEMMLSYDLMKRIGVPYWKERLIATGMIPAGTFSTDKVWSEYYFNDLLAIIKNKFPQQFVFDQMKWRTISPWSVKAVSRVIATPTVIDTSWKKTKIGASVGNYVIGAVAIGDVDNNGRQEIYYGDMGNYLYQCKWNGKDWEAKQIAKMEWAIKAVTVGDGDNDGNDELYVVGEGRSVYQFEWDGITWTRTIVGEDGDGILSVTIGDGNNDGINEIYVGCKNDWVYQFAWVNGFWVKSSVGETGSDIFKISIGDANNDGKKEIYIACEDGYVYSFRWINNQWASMKIARPDSIMFSVAVGDGDNDGKEEIYGVCFDGHAYQFKWHEKGWIIIDMGVVSGPEERNGACSLQDGDNDGKYELYVSSKSGHVYQFKWDGTSWMRIDIGNVNVPLHYVAIGDGDGDGLYDVYAADGGVYQFKVEPQLSLRVETQKVSYAIKEQIKISLKITNYSSQERVLKFKTTKMFDLRIKSIGSGYVVYDWAYNKNFADGVAIIRLAPGEEQVLTEIDWEQKDLYGSFVAGGKYCIEGNLALGLTGSHMEMKAKSKEIEICSAVPLWIPTLPAQQPYSEFDIEVRIGSITNQVKDMFGAAFRLNYNVNDVRLSVIRVNAGSLLGSDVVSFASSVDTNKGFVDIGLSRKREAGIGVDGYGVVARIRVRVDYIYGSSLRLSISNVDAVNSKGERILMEVSGTEIAIGGQVNVWPGDTNNDGWVDANDIIALAYYWQQTGYPRKNASYIWSAQVSSVWYNQYAVYADANGDGIVDGRDILTIGLNWGQKKVVQGAPGLMVKNNINCVGAYREMYKVLSESPETTSSEELKATLKGLIAQAVSTNIPTKSMVLQNYPNPFNPECWIPFELSEKARVVIKIYAITGQLIQTLDLGEKAAGTYLEKTGEHAAAHWDGRNKDGEEVASGVYFYRLEAGGQVSTKKMVVLR